MVDVNPPLLHLTRMLPRRIPIVLLALGLLLGSASTSSARQVQLPASAASGDFAGRVDIGGRSLYLECRGSGSPTVVLVHGYRGSGRFWTDDLLQPDAPRTMVLPAVAGFTRVCTYDRPGALATAPIVDDDVGDPSLSEAEAGVKIIPSRSDPVPQPRTVTDAVTELHALLGAAGVPGPYVIAGHSLGGLLARLYAASYPDEVIGLVLVHPYTEQEEPELGPTL